VDEFLKGPVFIFTVRHSKVIGAELKQYGSNPLFKRFED
jgi:hypothetical protein